MPEATLLLVLVLLLVRSAGWHGFGWWLCLTGWRLWLWLKRLHFILIWLPAVGRWAAGAASTVNFDALREGVAPAQAMALESSLTTALAVSTPGWWANIVGIMVPLTFLIVLYLQSERTLSEEESK